MSGPHSRFPAETLALWLALEPEQLLRRCAQSPFQGPGPGGQKRNRVYSGVRLVHAESGLSAEASERREARRNLEDALRRLRLAMALSIVPPRRSPDDAPTRTAAVLRDPAAGSSPAPPSVPAPAPCMPTFPAWCSGAPRPGCLRRAALSEAAAALGCTASALTRFLVADKAVWARAQAIRRAAWPASP